MMHKDKNRELGIFYLSQALNCKNQGEIEKAVDFLILACEIIPEDAIKTADMIFLRDKSFCEAHDNVSKEPLEKIIGEYKNRLKSRYEAIAANSGACVFCAKRAASPGKFIMVYLDYSEEPLSARTTKRTYSVRRYPCCDQCDTIVRGFELAGWGGMVLVGILAVILIAIPDIKSIQDIWKIPLAFFAALAFSGFIMQPVFNFLTWSLYTSKVGEPILHRMRMYK